MFNTTASVLVTFMMMIMMMVIIIRRLMTVMVTNRLGDEDVMRWILLCCLTAIFLTLHECRRFS